MQPKDMLDALLGVGSVTVKNRVQLYSGANRP